MRRRWRCCEARRRRRRASGSATRRRGIDGGRLGVVARRGRRTHLFGRACAVRCAREVEEAKGAAAREIADIIGAKRVAEGAVAQLTAAVDELAEKNEALGGRLEEAEALLAEAQARLSGSGSE